VKGREEAIMRLKPIITLLVGALVLAAQSLLPGHAGELAAANATPDFQTYQVKKGDTLFSIAEKFYGTGHGNWRPIAAENNVTPETLQTGMVLKIPMEPGTVYAEEPTISGAPTKNTKKVAAAGNGGTVGETMDAVTKRVSRLAGLIGLKFQDGPSYALKIVLAIFAGFALYVIADALMVWIGSLLLRVPEATLSRAGKVAVSSLGLQLLLVLSVLMLAAVLNQLWPDSANVSTLRSLNWESGTVWWPAFMAVILAFFFIPFSMAKQAYSINAGKATGVVFLACALKFFVAFFPSAIAFVATGAGAACMLW
jgi:hypothetical protein